MPSCRTVINGAAAVLALYTTSAGAQTGGPYSLTWNTLCGGGATTSAGGDYSLGGTAGRMDAGSLAAGTYALQGGFWSNGLTPTDAAPPPEVTDGTDPLVFKLHGNTPNPFVASTTIAFSMPRAAHAELQVFDLAGRRVRTLVDRTLAPGRHLVAWDGHDEAGRRAANGVYLLRVRAAEFAANRKLILLQ